MGMKLKTNELGEYVWKLKIILKSGVDFICIYTGKEDSIEKVEDMIFDNIENAKLKVRDKSNLRNMIVLKGEIASCTIEPSPYCNV